jgi:hypothetical protein
MNFLQRASENILPKSLKLNLFLFYGLLAGLLFPLLASKIRSNDIWKALYSGRYLWIFSSFPHHSTFTFSPVKDFIARDAYTWLSNLGFYSAYLGGDYYLVQLVRPLLLIGTLLLIHSIVNFRCRPSILAMFVLFSYAIDQKLHLRSSIVAVPFTVLLPWIWYRAKYCSRPQWLWGIPPVLVLWSNLHGSYLLGLGFLVLACFAETFERLIHAPAERFSLRSLWGILGLSVPGVILVKPMPDPLVQAQFRSLVRKIGQVVSGEAVLGPLIDILTGGFIQPGLGIDREFYVGRGGYRPVLDYLHLPLVQYSILLTLLALAVFWWLRGHWDYALGVWLIVTVPFGLRYTRTVAYLALTSLPLIVIVVSNYHHKTGKLPWGNRVELVATVCLVLFSVLIGYQLTVGQPAQLTGNPRFEVGMGTINLFSDRTPEYILNHYPDQRFLNPWGEGTYLIWKWWPYKKVYVDSKGVPYQDDFLGGFDSDWVIKWAFDHVVLWKHRPKADYYRRSKHWEVLVVDPGMIAFKRR